MVINIVEVILLLIVLAMLLPLKLSLMKIFVELFLIILTFAFVSQNFEIGTVFLCLIMLGNLFFVKSLASKENEELLVHSEDIVVKFSYVLILIAFIVTFSFYWFKEDLFPIRDRQNPLAINSIGLFVIIFILMNVSQKETNK